MIEDLTNRELHIGDTVAYIYTEYNRSQIIHGGTGIIIDIDEDKHRNVKVDFIESKNWYSSNKLIKI